MTAHAICLNDSVVFVVVGDEAAANEKLESLRKDYYAKYRHAFTSEKVYNGTIHWSIQTVEAIVSKL